MDTRMATLADIGLINSMAWRVFPPTYKGIIAEEQIQFMMQWMYSEENLRRQITRQGHTFLMAEEGKEPAGYVSVSSEEATLWELHKLYVLPDWQQKGVGKTLFNAAIAHIKALQQGPCVMQLHVNRHNKALGFYQHMGMKIAREGDFDIGNGFYMNDYILSIDL